MLRHLSRAPWWPFVALLAVTLVGGLAFNAVHAHGRLIADVTSMPVKDVRFVAYGARQYPVDDNGVFDIPDLPRGAKLTVIAPGYNRKEFDATETEVRLVVGVVSFQVNDAETKKGIPFPEARIGADRLTRVGRGVDSGNMAVAPAPDKDTAVYICAKDHIAQVVHVVQPIQEVFLAPQTGTGCPPIPTPIPAPTQPPLPTATPATSPSPSPAPNPVKSGNP